MGGMAVIGFLGTPCYHKAAAGTATYPMQYDLPVVEAGQLHISVSVWAINAGPTMAANGVVGRKRLMGPPDGPRIKKFPLEPSWCQGEQWSGRQDSNLRPLRPERNALAKLSYAPFIAAALRGRVRASMLIILSAMSTSPLSYHRFKYQ